jgi:DNA mismatch endonuclease (patch repair protein)
MPLNESAEVSVKHSDRMRRVGQKNTAPEVAVRRLLYTLGYRFRLNVAYLPGRPDIVLTAKKTAIFVHGCLWHRHFRCARATMPKVNVQFWQEKFSRTKQRDDAAIRQLESAGWKTIVIWECEATTEGELTTRLLREIPE